MIFLIFLCFACGEGSEVKSKGSDEIRKKEFLINYAQNAHILMYFWGLKILL